ncbi:hypothetical protein [Neolewinella persica]|uniref:hypothetical protein n=1 Tax=Neolewinella persica TaxID=70998 RepID=UPI00039F7603|nr:hypothetical protein [Neolewinella persica]
MKHLFTFLTLLVVFTSCSKEARLQNAIDYIGQADAFMGNAVGIAGTKPDVYKSYEQVLKLASPDQLFELINDDRAAVRIYGFQGMVETNHPETFLAFKVLLPDTTTLATMGGCIMSSEHVNLLATNLLISEYSKREFYQLKGRDRIVFDSLILFSGHLPLGRWTQPLESVVPIDQHYKAIKKLAHDSTSITARRGLANFEREADLDFLRSTFSMNESYDIDHAMEIISRFPHPSFLPFLEDVQVKILEPENSLYDVTNFYLAVFHYPAEDIKPFLEVLNGYPEGVIKKEHQQSAWIAAQLNGDPTKQHLVKAITLDEHKVHQLAWLRSLAKYANLD